eukprot:6761004-Heterocapsa_arctica.AAC.1
MASPQIPHRGPTLDFAPLVRRSCREGLCPNSYSTYCAPRDLGSDARISEQLLLTPGPGSGPSSRRGCTADRP